MELRSGWRARIARMVVAFVVILVVYRLGIDAYTSLLARGLDATVSIAPPEGMQMNSVESQGTVLKLFYTPDEVAAQTPPGKVPLPQWFEFDVAAVGTWDFLVVVTLFAGFALGCPGVAAARLAGLLAVLVMIDFVTIALVHRTAYDPALQEFDIENILLFGPWVQQVLPLALWFLFCPHDLWDRLRGAGRAAAPPPTTAC